MTLPPLIAALSADGTHENGAPRPRYDYEWIADATRLTKGHGLLSTEQRALAEACISYFLADAQAQHQRVLDRELQKWRGERDGRGPKITATGPDHHYIGRLACQSMDRVRSLRKRLANDPGTNRPPQDYGEALAMWKALIEKDAKFPVEHLRAAANIIADVSRSPLAVSKRQLEIDGMRIAALNEAADTTEVLSRADRALEAAEQAIERKIT